MIFVCPDDRQHLTGRDRTLCCDRCGRTYEAPDGIPVFPPEGDTREEWKQDPPRLRDLEKRLGERPFEEAVDSFCRDHEACRMGSRAGWRMVFPAPAGGRLLELGGGFGEDTVALAKEAARVISAVPNLANARILRRRLAEAGAGNVEVVVLTDLARMPLAGGAVDAIAADHLFASGFPVTRRRFGELAAEWRRILAPGGVLFLGIPNPFDFMFRAARSLLQSGRDEVSLNRLVKTAADAYEPPWMTLRAIRGTLALKGFGEQGLYAPFPNERRPQVVAPLDDRNLVDYFLSHLIRKNSPVMRAAVAAARGLNRIGLFAPLAPFYYLVVRHRKTG